MKCRGEKVKSKIKKPKKGNSRREARARGGGGQRDSWIDSGAEKSKKGMETYGESSVRERGKEGEGGGHPRKNRNDRATGARDEKEAEPTMSS